MDATNIFFGGDGMLRSGWRFAVFAVLFTLASIAAWVIFSALAFSFRLHNPTLFLFGSLASLGPAILVGWFCARKLEGLPFRSLGASFTQGWATHFLLGSLLGALSLSFAAGIAAAFGELDFSQNDVPLSNVI